jgi:hypothetical protein
MCKYELSTDGIWIIILANAEAHLQEEKWLVWPVKRDEQQTKKTGKTESHQDTCTDSTS